MKVVILGSGVIGVTTAYFLAERGHEVTVIDREPESARETSFANGGQLSYSHAEPWAHPIVFKKLPFWLLRKDAPFAMRWNADPTMWIWALRFLRQCTLPLNQLGTRNSWRLASYSRECFLDILAHEDIQFNYRNHGILHIYQHQKELDGAIREAEFKKELGCDFEALDAKTCIEREPALRNSSEKLAGGIVYPMDKTGDIHDFTMQLAEIDTHTGPGVTFHYNTTIQSLLTEKGKIDGVVTDKGTFTADAYVVAMGSYSPLILKTVGIHVPIYPLKGYSITIPTDGYHGAPEMGLTDQSKKIVYSRLGNTLRVAGTAELAGYDDRIREDRIAPIVAATKALFPECGDFSKMTKWACLRSSTPDGCPILGKTRYDNLFLNTGHGSLGWTLSCGSSRIVADIIEGKTPAIDMTGLTIERYS